MVFSVNAPRDLKFLYCLVEGNTKYKIAFFYKNTTVILKLVPKAASEFDFIDLQKIIPFRDTVP